MSVYIHVYTHIVCVCLCVQSVYMYATVAYGIHTVSALVAILIPGLSVVPDGKLSIVFGAIANTCTREATGSRRNS